MNLSRNKLKIVINRPIGDVFEFTVNPKNTPLWIDSVAHEEASPLPVDVGTVYKNRSRTGKQYTFTMTSFKPNDFFEMIASDKNYHVRYTYKPIDSSTTEMEYVEWMETGDLDAPFTQDVLEKLKSVMEKS
jgi:hypothetical protein